MALALPFPLIAVTADVRHCLKYETRDLQPEGSLDIETNSLFSPMKTLMPIIGNVFMELMAGSEEGREGSHSCLGKLRFSLLIVACNRNWRKND